MPELNIAPHPGRQVDFLKSTCDRVFYGGARGGGKSLSIAWKVALEPVEWHYVVDNMAIGEEEYRELLKRGVQNVKISYDMLNIDVPDFIGILIRRSYPQLERNLRPECEKLYPLFGGKWQERNHCWLFPSGARVYMVHCRDRKALDNYIGGNYQKLGIDEANQFPWDWVEELSTSVRSSDIRIKPQLLLTSNPGNVGHLWLKKKFVEKCKPIPVGEMQYSKDFDVYYQPYGPGKPYIDDEKISWQFIPATVFDNPTLLKNDPGYVRRLKGLSPALRAMWLEGRWDVAQGMFFDMWDEELHVIPRDNFIFGSHFTKETHSLYRFYDYGTKSPFACLFAAVDPEGRMVVFDELVKTGLSASKQVEEVNRYTYKKYGLTANDFDLDIADPAYWIKHSEKNGALYSPAMFYADAGIYLTKGNNDRKAGAKVLYDALTPAGGELMPRIRFTDNCEYCIDTFPSLPQSDNDPEDIDTKADDHAYDALRVGAMRLLFGERKESRGKAEIGWRERIWEKSQGSAFGNIELIPEGAVVVGSSLYGVASHTPVPDYSGDEGVSWLSQ